MRLSEILKKGSGVPTTGVIPVGGLAVDVENGKLYSKKSNGEIFEVGALNFNDQDLQGLEAVIAQNGLDIQANAEQITLLWNTPSIKNDQSLKAIVTKYYNEYLGVTPSENEWLYWVQEVNNGNLSVNTLEEAFYNACVQNGETLLKTYISPEEQAKLDAWMTTINNADENLIKEIQSWYTTILKRYTVDDESLAYWIKQVELGNIVREDLDEAIFRAAIKLNQPCYLVPDTVTDYEIGDGGYAVPVDGINDEIIDAPEDGGDVTTIDGVTLTIADSPNNIQAHIDYLNANTALVIKIINIYYTYFHRSPEVEGAYYWAYQYNTLGWDDNTLEEAIYHAGLLYDTPIFAVYDNSQTNEYQKAFEQSLKNLQDAQTSGDINYVNNASAAKASSEIAFVQATQNDYNIVTASENTEIVNQIVDLYKTVLGRPEEAIYADTAGIAYWTEQVKNGAVSLEDMSQALETAAEEYKWYKGGSEWA